MKYYFILILVFFTNSVGAYWDSPIDEKYRTSSPLLFSSFSKARDIIDSYRGETNKLLEAQAILEKILSRDADFAPTYREYARLVLNAGLILGYKTQEDLLNAAIKLVYRSIEIEPEYADAYVLLGYLYLRNKPDLEKARVALDQAMDIGTELPWLHNNYGELLKRKKQYNEAIKYYQKVIDSNTDNRGAYSSALMGIAVSHRTLGNIREADKWHEKSARYDNSAWNWGEYSRFLLFWADEVDAAIEAGEKALSIRSYGAGRMVLACAYYVKWVQLEATDKDTAGVYMDKAQSLMPLDLRVITEVRRFKPTNKYFKRLLTYFNEEIMTPAMNRPDNQG